MTQFCGTTDTAICCQIDDQTLMCTVLLFFCLYSLEIDNFVYSSKMMKIKMYFSMMIMFQNVGSQEKKRIVTIQLQLSRYKSVGAIFKSLRQKFADSDLR
jgi:hypothetical protein